MLKSYVFSKFWRKNWQKEFGVSLKFPNKRFPISKTEDYLRNIWSIRRHFLEMLGLNVPSPKCWDQMSLHRNVGTKCPFTEILGPNVPSPKSWDQMSRHRNDGTKCLFTEMLGPNVSSPKCWDKMSLHRNESSKQ